MQRLMELTEGGAAGGAPRGKGLEWIASTVVRWLRKMNNWFSRHWPALDS